MKPIASIYLRLFAVVGGLLLAIWCFLYLPDSIKIYGFAFFAGAAFLYTLYALLTRNRRFDLKKIWKEILDALYGL